LAPICIKSFVGRGFTQTPLGELTALPRSPSWLGGGVEPPEKGREEKGEKRKGEREWKGGEKGEGGERTLNCPTLRLNLLDLPLLIPAKKGGKEGKGGGKGRKEKDPKSPPSS